MGCIYLFRLQIGCWWSLLRSKRSRQDEMVRNTRTDAGKRSVGFVCEQHVLCRSDGICHFHWISVSDLSTVVACIYHICLLSLHHILQIRHFLENRQGAFQNILFMGYLWTEWKWVKAHYKMGECIYRALKTSFKVQDFQVFIVV